MVTDFVSIVRELSLDELRDEAMTAPKLLVVGEPGPRERLSRDLFEIDNRPFLRQETSLPPAEAEHPDLVLVVWTGTDTPGLRRTVGEAQTRGWPVLVVSTVESAPPDDALLAAPLTWVRSWRADDLDAARSRVAAAFEEPRWLALGRHLPAMRAPVATTLVGATARANAQFAALANLPAIIPLFGNIAGASADMLVLTKNQLLLIYKLAAIYGRDMENRRQIYLEMAPVVGAALLWRTVARELVALVPGFLGALPKIGIAYTGTYAVGRAAQYYYEVGRVPTREEWEQFTRQALTWWTSTRQHWQSQVASALPTPSTNNAHPRGFTTPQSDGPVVH
jgi:uncharacterized protein (DUF697 family)